MDFTSNIALVALVVSLAALMITTIQLLQQLLGTDEGYRRCAEPMMGPWRRLRWRRWISREFRFETHFVTPKILLYSEDEREGFREMALPLMEAVNEPPLSRKSRVLLEIRMKCLRRDKDVLQMARLVLAETITTKETKENKQYSKKERGDGDSPQTSFKHSPDIEKHSGETDRSLQAKPKRFNLTLQNDDKVSWLTLLQCLHKTYSGYQAIDPSDEKPMSENAVKTTAAVAFVSRLWDTLPNGTSKPLASTTVGDLIIFGFRLGMQWRTVDIISSRTLLADGNGYTISAREVPGIGFVAKLSVTSGHQTVTEIFGGWATDLIPGRATDKLMCGIIPTCRALMPRDFEYALDDRKVSHLTVKDRLKGWIGFSGFDHAEFGYWEALNETVTLLCEFLPVPGSNATTHYFWCWAPQRKSIFHHWEGRQALLQVLTEMKEKGETSVTILEVQERLSHLKKEYPDDFYTKWNRAAVIGKNTTDETQADRTLKQMRLLDKCRAIWNWTTKWFEENCFSTQGPEGDSNQTCYMHLVAAHYAMSCTTIGGAFSTVDQLMKDNPKWGDKQKRDHYLQDNEGIAPEWLGLGTFQVALSYVQKIQKESNEENTVVKYMQSRGIHIDREIIKTAWWVLMLRGIAWNMSTIERSCGEVVPASLYNNKTPIWIE